MRCSGSCSGNKTTGWGWTVTVFSATCFSSARTKPPFAIMWSTKPGTPVLSDFGKKNGCSPLAEFRVTCSVTCPAAPGTKPIGSTLYHLTNDPKEKVNVYNQYPEVVQRLEQILEKEKARMLSTDSGDHE